MVRTIGHVTREIDRLVAYGYNEKLHVKQEVT